MKQWMIVGILAMPALMAPAWVSAWPNSSLPPYRGPGSQTLPLDEMRRRAYDQDREWQRRDEEERRRAEDERQRRQWRLEDERRREALRERDERARTWEQRGAYDWRRMDREGEALMQRNDEGQAGKKGGQGGFYREREHTGKPLNSKELRRYELIKPGERP